VAGLLADARIVRNRAKVLATITNARATVRLRDTVDGGLAGLVWSSRPESTPRPHRFADIPTQSEQSVALAGDLKRRGFRFVGQVQGLVFLFQTTFALFVLGNGLFGMGKLLLLQRQFAADAVCLVLLGLEGGVERGLGFFQFGQTLFMFGNLHRPFRQLGLLFFGLQLVFFKLHADLLLLLMDALHLRLRRLLVAFDALVQVLLMADLFFQTGNLLAQHTALVAQFVYRLLLRLFGGLQGVYFVV